MNTEKDFEKLMPKRIEFEITHLCNKMCDNCSHRIKNSSFKYTTLFDLDKIISCLNPKEFNSVLITGGEPLCHPFFEQFMKKIKEKFPHLSKQAIIIQTNGTLLEKVPKQVFEQFSWWISEYPGWNDKIIKKYCNNENVSIHPWNSWWPLKDPNLNEIDAKIISEKCPYHQIRIIGTKLYRCCHSEGIERNFSIEKVHSDISKNWKFDWINLPVWKACQHCHQAFLIQGKWKSNKEFRNISHKHKLNLFNLFR